VRVQLAGLAVTALGLVACGGSSKAPQATCDMAARDRDQAQVDAAQNAWLASRLVSNTGPTTGDRYTDVQNQLAAQRAAGETSWTDFAAFRLVYGTLAAFAEQNPSCFTPERRAGITALNRLLTS
jgi:hypothetical protein